jgi:ferrochelatase
MAGNGIGVLLMAYGAANSTEEVAPYLADIRAGRPPSPELIEEVKHRYELMGGKSPLLHITQLQAAALEARLNQNLGKISEDQASPVRARGVGVSEDLPPKAGRPHGPPHIKVYIGMRHWHPYIKDTVAIMAQDGIRKMVALCLTPYYSKMSVGAYFKKLDEAVAATGVSFEIRPVESWNDHPLLIEAIAQKLNKALDRFPQNIRSIVPLLFSAHSLPERILAEKDPYPAELHETVELVMKKIGSNPYRFAYQSRGRTPEPWLGPDAGKVIDELHDQGHKALLMAPIGFISDHMETLYDVDVMYRKQAESKGMRFERAESLNATPTFIEAMASVIRAHLQS